MVYVEYDVNSKLVVKISESEIVPNDGYAVATSDIYAVGDEFELSIYVNEVTETGFIISHAAVRNNPNAARLLRENQELKNALMNPVEKFKNIDRNNIDIEAFKAARIEALKYESSQAMYFGFVSTVVDSKSTPYEFGFNEHDQSNFEKMTSKISILLHQLNRNELTQEAFDAKFPIQWKTKNKGVVSLTLNEFIQVTDDAEAHLMSNQIKYWQLESQINAAETIQDVSFITW